MQTSSKVIFAVTPWAGPCQRARSLCMWRSKQSCNLLKESPYVTISLTGNRPAPWKVPDQRLSAVRSSAFTSLSHTFLRLHEKSWHHPNYREYEATCLSSLRTASRGRVEICFLLDHADQGSWLGRRYLESSPQSEPHYWRRSRTPTSRTISDAFDRLIR